jgi:uncharacterized Tic20 family protein
VRLFTAAAHTVDQQGKHQIGSQINKRVALIDVVMITFEMNLVGAVSKETAWLSTRGSFERDM